MNDSVHPIDTNRTAEGMRTTEYSCIDRKRCIDVIDRRVVHTNAIHSNLKKERSNQCQEIVHL